jgi:UDP-N-acetylglucosamine acyltransferase
MNNIDPTVVIRGKVEMGTGNEILPYSVLIGPLTIGDNNYIGPHVTIGTPGEDTRNPRYDSSECRIEIGSDNIIREYTAIQKPGYRDVTRLGNKCFLMNGTHVAHDVIVEDHVVAAPKVVMGGIVRIMKGASLGISSMTHQYSVIGPYSIVAMGAAVMKNVRPFSRFIPGKPISLNSYAIRKYGFEEYNDEIEAYVMDSARPTSPKIAKIIESFEEAHLGSERQLY